MTSDRRNILVAGAINTDLVATMQRAPDAGETITGSSFAVHGGGKGANQAVAAARSGGSVALVGAIGNDDFGRARISGLREHGIDTTWVSVAEDVASGVALIFVEDGGENRIAYVPGATLTVPPALALRALREYRPMFLLATNELAHESLKPLLRAAHDDGAVVVFNATPDPETAIELLEFVSVLIVNEGEAAALVGTDHRGDSSNSVRTLLGKGLATVILTVGEKGVIVDTAEGIARFRTPEVHVVDTTGAGDTFCGAFVAELSRVGSIVQAARYGVLASALSVTREGAQSSIPTRAEVIAGVFEPAS